MSEDPNLVEVIANGMSYRGWTAVTVSAALDETARSFTLEIVEPSGDGSDDFMAWPLDRGDNVEIRLGGVLAVTGYVDTWQTSFSDSAHGASVDGRSKTGDAIDSSVDVEKGEFSKVGLDALAKKLFAETGVDVKVQGDVGKPFDVVRVQPGETAFEVIDRLARMRGFTLTDNAQGDLVLRKDSDGADAGAVATLIEGQNIKSGRATFKADEKFSEVKVKAQQPRPADDDSDGDYWSDVEATAKDETVKRKRVLVIQAEEPGDKEAAQDRADREVEKRKAESIECSVTVFGFFSAPGKLWEPGDKVHVTSRMMRLDRVLQIKTVEWKQGVEDGSTTEISLQIPEAMGGKSGAGAAKKTGRTPARGGNGGGDFPTADYWQDKSE